MKCCHSNDSHRENEHKSRHKSYISHFLMMLLCCGAPLIIWLLLPLIGQILPGSSSFLSSIAPYICPIMMLAMVPMMLKENRENYENKTCENKQLNDNVQNQM